MLSDPNTELILHYRHIAMPVRRNRTLTVTSKKVGGNCGMAQITHKVSGKNVNITNSARIWPSLQTLHGIPDSAQNYVHAESQNSTGPTLNTIN